MEEPEQGSPASDDRSQKTAAALRALRDGLGSKLETHRRRISDLEVDLTSRVLEIAEEMAQDQTAEAQAGSQLHDDQLRKLRSTLTDRESTIAALQRKLSDAELHQLRLSAELTDSRSAMGAVKSKECASCGALRSQLANAKEDVASLETRVEELLKVVSKAQEALVELRDAESKECAQLHAELTEKQSRIEVGMELAAGLESRVESLTQELSQSRTAEQQLRDQHNADNAAQIKAQLTVAQVQQQLTEQAAELTAVSERESQAAERADELFKQIESLTAELTESRETQAQLSAQHSASDATLAESQTAAGEMQRRIDEQAAELAAVAERESQAKAQIDELLAQVDALKQKLDQADEAKIQLAAQQSEGDSTLASLHQTLADTQQSLKDRTAEFEEATKRESHANSQIDELQLGLAEVQQSLKDCALQLEDATQRETHANTRIEELAGEVKNLAEQLSTAHNVEAELQALHSADDTALAESRRVAEEMKHLLDERTAELAAMAERESAVNSRAETLLAQVESLTADLTAAQQAESKLLAQHFATDAALADAKATAEESQHSLKAELADLAVVRETLAEELAAARAELTARAESTTSEVTWLEKEREAAEQSRNQLAADFEELLKKHKATEETLAEAHSRSEQASAALRQAEEQIEKLTSTAEDELSQARKKFELALADAQKLKRENAELQEELAKRPEVAETESPELVSLRVERDALATRIAELETAPTPTVDEDSEQRFADLQRRFELAVEDLRRLKQENAQLQDKLTQTAHHSGGPVAKASNQAMDWQAQKARLLAALESEEAEEPPAPERRQELVTIEGTISITDSVVAEKDREIAELRDQLTERPVTVVEKSPATELFEKDELIAAERSKLEALQKEWHEKLRTAEMEMSLQRATLARKEAELEQKMQAAQEAQSDPAIGADGKPRRRWLSALGLRDDEEKDGKK